MFYTMIRFFVHLNIHTFTLNPPTVPRRVMQTKSGLYPVIEIYRQFRYIQRNLKTHLLSGETMNKILFRFCYIIVLICFCFGWTFSQGITWESTTTTPMTGAKEIHSTSYYRPHMFKQTSDNDASIFRLDKETLIRVDSQRKEYSEMTFAELESQVKQASGELDARMAEMQKKLESMPPEQRKMVEQMMGDKLKGGSGEGKVDVTKTSETKTISGYPCTKYVVKQGDKDFATLWTTTSIPDFGTMKDDFKEFSQRISSMMPSKGAQIADGMKKVEGFPIQSTIAGITTTVTKVEKRTIAASEFEPPPGFTKVKAESIDDKLHRDRTKQQENGEQPKEQN
jgi:hypothetical protein